jgi:hypothetical protein
LLDVVSHTAIEIDALNALQNSHDWVDLGRGQWWITFSTVMPVDVSFHAMVSLRPLPLQLHAWSHGLRTPCTVHGLKSTAFISINTPSVSDLTPSLLALGPALMTSIRSGQTSDALNQRLLNRRFESFRQSP